MSRTASLRVCFTPIDGVNPYQRALADELGRLGVHVSARASLRGLPAALVRGTESAHVVHLHWLPTVQLAVRPLLQVLLFLVNLRLLKALGCRVVWTVHNLHHHEARHRDADHWVARRVAAVATRVIVHSRAARSIVADTLRVRDSRKLVVVPHGTYVGSYANAISRTEARRRLRLEDDAMVLLFFGNIRPYKGVTELVEAFKRLAAPGTDLLVVGKAAPATRAALERSVRECPRIHLVTGLVADEDVQCYMNAADAVVLPYLEVLTSGALVLAMSFGRACVAPAFGAIPEVLPADGAVLYDPADADGLLTALGSLVAHRDELSRMGARNLERARQWSWTQVARQTAAVYAAALGSTARHEQSAGVPFNEGAS